MKTTVVLLRTFLYTSMISTLLTSCSSDNDDTPTASSPVYSANLIRTEFGIPHVKANDWGSLGYGYGYAIAQDGFCTIMREIINAQGESARYFGEDGDLDADFVYKHYNNDTLIQETWIGTQAEELLALGAGYVAGLNRYLQETGSENLASGEEGCRNELWVRPVTELDIYKLLRKISLRASTSSLVPLITAIEAPPETVSNKPESNKPGKANSKVKTAGTSKPVSPELKRLAAKVQNLTIDWLPKPQELGSNAYALGANVTQNGRGMLLGNPHFPWQGPERFYMVHLTIPGEYDMMGASLHGLPIVNLGFNANIAWTHTVSTGRRFTLYELTLAEDNPMQYIYDKELRDISSVTVTAEELLDNGEVVSREKTLYFSHFGPLIDISLLDSALQPFGGWPALGNKAYVMKDANLDNNRGLRQWQQMGLAQNIEELENALQIIGIPWVNTIAADRFGTAYYGDISAVPHVSTSKQNTCANSFIAGPLLANRILLLDGTDSACEWGTDEDAPTPGVFAASNLPKLNTQDYAANANDSYWLSHPDQLLTGFPLLVGEEQIQQSLRTRLAFLQVEQRINGEDGLAGTGFNLDNLREIMFGSRNIAAELMLDEFLPICQAVSDWSAYSTNPDAAAEACTLLAAWDQTSNIDSVGQHIFHEFWFALLGYNDDTQALISFNDLWQIAFDATDPVNTPRDLDAENSTVQEALKSALGQGVDFLLANNIALNQTWGNVQFATRNGVDIPIHGGSGRMGFSVITSDLIANSGYSDIVHGNSFMQTVGWDDSDCPDAFMLLSYSQSSDPESPHYADQTQRYSDKQWLDIPYCDSDIEATKISEISLSNQ